jgi:hypothetical protein
LPAMKIAAKKHKEVEKDTKTKRGSATKRHIKTQIDTKRMLATKRHKKAQKIKRTTYLRVFVPLWPNFHSSPGECIALHDWQQFPPQA